MPAMPRPRGKATEIAFSILGVPANLRISKKGSKKKKIEERLSFEYSSQIR